MTDPVPEDEQSHDLDPGFLGAWLIGMAAVAAYVVTWPVRKVMRLVRGRR
jgi:hypothetical protein